MGIFSLFDTVKEPVFLKEKSSSERTIQELKQLSISASSDIKSKIEQDIRMLTAGIIGESRISYELKNSHMPMCVLHDLFLSDNGLTAQIDYLVVTRKCIFVIECKNLYGNIEITKNGDFIRTVPYNGKFIREGIYSPITQNQRHIELLKQIRMKERESTLTRLLNAQKIDESYQSVVALANDKTILNSRYAPYSIKDCVVRTDHLIEYINTKNDFSSSPTISEKEMMSLGQFYLDHHTENPTDYMAKYESCTKTNIQNDRNQVYFKNQATDPSTFKAPARCNFVEADAYEKQNEYKRKPELDIHEELVKDLKNFRFNRSKAENIKAYFIFNDEQMEDLILKMPKNNRELLYVSGFGEAKCQKYGNAIINILDMYRR